ncbi:hypothetical protein G4Y79_23950 [Phototrophicus methaneseepsis]|uniref:indole-3-glycerol-phosphate synthase n=1 Tax=Phototrophicus methaneseepsis TaxID=2710758 RepID=A0A7S8E983_9CHLR|nr:hypothetical protein [Phototrophicus methaneseepsis]QPC82700.1 hypothetical protein G4Y79_23950 [Phototrophicus methaneseepsis]
MLEDMPREVVIANKTKHLQVRRQQTPLPALFDLAHMQSRPNYMDWDAAPLIVAQITLSEIYDPIGTSIACLHHGADAIAFFTDHVLYSADIEDLQLLSRALPNVPIIYQNYVLDVYGVVAARAAGASAIWLYSDLLPAETLRELASTAQRWKMPVYLQVDSYTDPSLIEMIGPRVLCYSEDNLAEWRAPLPALYEVMPSQVCQTLDELSAARHAYPSALLVSSRLFAHPRIQTYLPKGSSHNDLTAE